MRTRWPSPELFYKAIFLISLNQLVVQPLSLLMSYPTLFEPCGITAFAEGQALPEPLEIIKVNLANRLRCVYSIRWEMEML